MSMTLAYLDDLSRVQIQLSDAGDLPVRVERSTNELLWLTVRGGRQLPLTDGAASLDDFEFQADVENHYRAMAPVTPALVGAEAAGVQTGTVLEVDWPIGVVDGDVALLWWSTSTGSGQPDPPAGFDVVHVHTADSGSHLAGLYRRDCDATETGTVELVSGGSNRHSCVLTVWRNLHSDPLAEWAVMDTPAEGTDHPCPAVDVDHDRTLVITAYQERQSGGTIDITAPTGYTRLAHSGSQAADGGGTYVAAAASDLHDTGTQETPPDWTDSEETNNVVTWTVALRAADAETVVGDDSISPDLEGRVWLKSIRFPFLNRWVDVWDWTSTTRGTRSGLFEIKGRSSPIEVDDVRASQAFTLEVATRDLRMPSEFDPMVEARDLDLILASGSPFFVHVPAGSAVPGGYVSIRDTDERRIVRAGTNDVSRVFTLPCRVKAPPGPDVVGGTMTYGALLNLYGSYEATLAANPTYADLLALMATPDDLVVL